MLREKSTNSDASLDQFSLAGLPADKTKAIVFYCSGPGGRKSCKAAVLAIKQGYTNVRWMRGGMIDWSVSYPVEKTAAPV